MDGEILGPVNYIAVEFPDGHITGEGFEHVLDLVDRGILRVLDLGFLSKAADGTVSKIALADIEHGGRVDVTIWQGASSGMLDQADIDQVAAVIQPGSLAGILVYENIWAVPMMTTLDRSDARLVGEGSILPEDLLTALDASEPA